MSQVNIAIKLVCEDFQECLELKRAIIALASKYNELHLSIQAETIPSEESGR